MANVYHCFTFPMRQKGNNFHLSVSYVMPEMLRHKHISSKSHRWWQGFSFLCSEKGSTQTMAICQVPKTRGTHNQWLRKTKRYSQTRRAKIANETPRLRSDSYEARSTERLDYVLTRTRHARQDASTMLWLVWGTLDGMPRPCFDSHEARSTRHLDYWEISDSHDPGSDCSTHLVHQLWDKSQSI
jgi:hypothetical protein